MGIASCYVEISIPKQLQSPTLGSERDLSKNDFWNFRPCVVGLSETDPRIRRWANPWEGSQLKSLSQRSYWGWHKVFWGIPSAQPWSSDQRGGCGTKAVGVGRTWVSSMIREGIWASQQRLSLHVSAGAQAWSSIRDWVRGEESPERSVKDCMWAGTVSKSCLGLTPPCLCSLDLVVPWSLSDSHDGNILPTCAATCLSSWPLDLVGLMLSAKQLRYKAVYFQSKVRQKPLCKSFQVRSIRYDTAFTMWLNVHILKWA